MRPGITCAGALLAVASGMAAMSTHAAPVVLSPAGGHAVALLAHDAHVHAEAFRKAVLLSDRMVPFKGVPVAIRKSPKFVSMVQRKVFSATVATFEYTPNGADTAPLRIHARSGKSLDATLGDIVRHQTPGATSGSTSEAGERVSEGEVLADAGDTRFYPVSSDIRATNLQKKDIWVVEPSPEADGRNVARIIHGTDAELKALRQLEYEFEKNPSLQRAGGKLTGYVSQEVCHSCRAAFDAFGSRYNVDITMHYLDTTAPPAVVSLADTTVADADAASRASAAMLRNIRRQAAAELLDPSALAKADARAAAGVANWPDGTVFDNLAAAEAGHLGLPSACLHE
jgi:hypothetical protein